MGGTAEAFSTSNFPGRAGGPAPALEAARVAQKHLLQQSHCGRCDRAGNKGWLNLQEGHCYKPEITTAPDL